MENDTIFVGKKPIMAYVVAVLTHVNSGHDFVLLKARGSMISKAVDISQIIKRKFSKDLKVGNIEIGTEEIISEGDVKKRNVSYISIEMKR
ncbi:MAG: DNA-binding protein Alba [Candidatus Parvarchaeota archaeon]|nr:DNA-binding protein Alba [Candidatus Parvarchaeota archaeon]MCL5101051.1 DNA-binding protein Alba [Candidatus Parvarchaeota archaeon]